MATKILIRGMTAIDRVVVGCLMTGLTFALIQYAQNMALSAHFV